MKYCIAALAALLVTACTTTAETANMEADASAAVEREELICDYERDIGSSLRRNRCITKEEAEERRRAARELNRRLDRPRNSEFDVPSLPGT